MTPDQQMNDQGKEVLRDVDAIIATQRKPLFLHDVLLAMSLGYALVFSIDCWALDSVLFGIAAAIHLLVAYVQVSISRRYRRRLRVLRALRRDLERAYTTNNNFALLALHEQIEAHFELLKK